MIGQFDDRIHLLSIECLWCRRSLIPGGRHRELCMERVAAGAANLPLNLNPKRMV